MSAVVERGTAPVEQLADWLGARAHGAARSEDPWTMTGVEITYAMFESRRAATLPLLPGAMTQPTTGYSRLLCLRCDGSPVGPFSLALLAVSGRHKYQPRDLLVDAVGSSAVVGAGAPQGVAVREGEVRIDRGPRDTVTEIADGSGTIARLVQRPRVIDPVMIRFEAMVFPARVDRVLGLASIRLRVDPEAGWLDTSHELRLGDAAVGTVWGALHSPWQVTSTVSVADEAAFEVPDGFAPL